MYQSGNMYLLAYWLGLSCKENCVSCKCSLSLRYTSDHGGGTHPFIETAKQEVSSHVVTSNRTRDNNSSNVIYLRFSMTTPTRPSYELQFHKSTFVIVLMCTLPLGAAPTPSQIHHRHPVELEPRATIANTYITHAPRVHMHTYAHAQTCESFILNALDIVMSMYVIMNTLWIVVSV